MRIKSSASDIRINRETRQTTEKLSQNSAKLASGNRIVRSSDDAAGLSISEKLKASTRSKQQASRNAQDSMGVLEIMEGTLSGMSEMIVRMRELSIQAASDSVSDTERGMLNLEVTGLLQELKRTAEGTEYLDNKLLKGDNKKLTVQVDKGNNEYDRISIDLVELAQTPLALGISDVKVDSQLRARLSLQKLDYAQGSLSQSRAKLGAMMSRMESTINNLSTSVVQETNANSRIKDLDYAQATAEQTSAKIRQSGQVSLAAQMNHQKGDALKLIS